MAAFFAARLASAEEKLYNGKMDEKIRINKYLSEVGFCSRREADSLILAGRVVAEGHKVGPGEKITAETVVFVDGKPVEKEQKKVLLLFHKPRGVVCSTKQQRQEITVTEYLKYPIRVYPVGRLDKDSEGLLLLTNQGDLVNRIMRAGNYHEKEYLVTVNRPVDGEFVRRMSSGIPILDTVTRPCFVEKTGKNSFRIILTQGLNRQIRRMCEYLGYKVLTLKRVRVMDLTLEGLGAGQYREATSHEWKQLKEKLQDSSQLPEAEKKKLLENPIQQKLSDSHKEKNRQPIQQKTVSSHGNHRKKTGGQHGKFLTANERTGRNPESGVKGVLSGKQRTHEQSGVRQPVRPAGAVGKGNRHRSHK